MTYQTVLFDLDGTLTDPKEGITKSVQYALEKMGIVEPDLEVLIPFIGPPLLETFQLQYNFSEQEAHQAIAYYRERFSVIGLYENAVFAGVENMLQQLTARGIQLAVATSKPTVFAQKILDHFELSHYFDVIVGSHLDGRRTLKAEVITDALKHFEEVGNAIMIGDRKHDLIGAKANSIPSIGVTFGYGSLEELTAAEATFIAYSIDELTKLLLKD